MVSGVENTTTCTLWFVCSALRNTSVMPVMKSDAFEHQVYTSQPASSDAFSSLMVSERRSTRTMSVLVDCSTLNNDVLPDKPEPTATTTFDSLDMLVQAAKMLGSCELVSGCFLLFAAVC
jgi:hypothetical protein